MRTMTLVGFLRARYDEAETVPAFAQIGLALGAVLVTWFAGHACVTARYPREKARR